MNCIKVKYKTYEGAVINLKKINKLDLDIYKCKCGFYHLGHSKHTSKEWKFQRRIDQLLGYRK